MSSLLPGIKRLFRLDVGRGHVERDAREELAFHFERTVAELVEDGWDTEDARREANRRFGDVERYQGAIVRIDHERVARRRRGQWWEHRRQDLTFAVRGLLRTPGFTAMVAVTLGLGLGANAVMFGVVDRLMVQPPAHVDDPDRVVRLYLQRDRDRGRSFEDALSYADLGDLLSNPSFRQAAMMSFPAVAYGTGESTRTIQAGLVSEQFFALVGVRPALGRFPLVEEHLPTGAHGAPVVLSWEFWQREFAGDPSAMGQAIRLGALTYTLTGVAPRGFNGVNLQPVDVWLPLITAANESVSGPWETNRRFRWLRGIAKLHEDAGRTTASAAATTIYRQANSDRPSSAYTSMITAPLIAARGPLQSGAAKVSRWLTGVSVVVLLIAIANVANLMLARATRRRRETAIRLALGVGRRRLIGQMLTEGLMLAGFGMVVAAVAAHWGGAALRAYLLPGVAWTSTAFGGRVAVFIGVVTVFSGLAASVIPAVQASRPDLTLALKASGMEGLRRSKTRASLLVAQAALSVILLVGAGLFARSVRAVGQTDLGFDRDVVVGQFRVPPGVRTQEEEARMYQVAAERVEAGSFATSSAIGSSVPFWTSMGEQVIVPGRDSLPRVADGGPYFNLVTPDYFRTMGIEILRGRGFTRDDADGAPPVAVLGQTMARLIWPYESSLGQCIKIGADTMPCTRVVGVAEDARRQLLIEGETMQFYLPLTQGQIYGQPGAVFVRPRGDAAHAIAQLRDTFVSVAPGLPPPRIRTLGSLLAGQTRSWQLGATMFSLFGGLALVTASVGLFSLLSYVVGQRIPELGVRAALGASRGRLIALVMRQALGWISLGIAVGVVGALVGGRFVAPLLYQVEAVDAVAYGTAVGVLLFSALLAGFLPALRASRVDPVTALRAE